MPQLKALGDMDAHLKDYGVKSKEQKEKVTELIRAIWGGSRDYAIITDITLTPKMAQAWIDTIKRQRNLRQKDVDNYESDMKDGRWQSRNGSTMVFDWNGEFRDGQHRAYAVCFSKKSITVDVAVGVNPDVVRTIDTGISRTAADTLVMEEKEYNRKLINSSAIATALKIIEAHEKGNIYSKIRMTNDQVYSSFKNHPAIMESAEKVCKKDNLANKPVSIALHYLFSLVKCYQNLADEFFESFITGVNLSPDSPVLALRKKFIAAKGDKKAHITRSFYISCIIRAWEYYKRGKPLTMIVYNSESLPTFTKKIVGKIRRKK